MLHFLTDEHISPTISRELLKRIPGVKITALSQWRGGDLMGADDQRLLQEAEKDGLTLVTYDQRTIRPLLKDWVEQNVSHSGVIFVDEKTIRPNDFGSLVKALGALWKSETRSSWKNRVVFLRAGDN